MTQDTPETEKTNLEAPKSSREVLWKIRPSTKEDVSFVMDSWLRSFRKSPYSGVVPRNLYVQVYSECIRQLLARGARLMVACNPEAPEQILGFICYESPGVLHYVYVKELYRDSGIAKSLVAYAGLDRKTMRYTFRTFGSRWLGGVHQPEIARKKNGVTPD